tara:strand:+ start:419 stop:625 length:207 start_codon:yes stop_codon:yes gene_type:complete
MKKSILMIAVCLSGFSTAPVNAGNIGDCYDRYYAESARCDQEPNGGSCQAKAQLNLKNCLLTEDAINE